MKPDQMNEHKKGIKAKIYNKKPQPLIGPEAIKKTAKAKSVPAKPKMEKSVTETAKLSTREKFKRSLKRAGFDPDASAKRIEDLLARQKKEREEFEKKYSSAYGTTEKDMKENKQTEVPAPRNFVAKNAKTAGAGKHKDAKKASKEVRGQKHKNKEMAEGTEERKENRLWQMITDYEQRAKTTKSAIKKDHYMKMAKELRDKLPTSDMDEARFSGLKPRWNKKPTIQHYGDDDEDTGEPKDTLPKDPYHRARAERIRAALQQYKDERFPDLEEAEWDQQSDETIPPEYDMDPEELKALRNTDLSDEEKLEAMIKLAAGGTSDDEIAQIFDMDKQTVASILDDYIEDIEAAMEPEDDVKEAEMGKVVDYKPGQTATLSSGPGMTTIIDLKKNPTSLTKDPATGKLKLMGPQATGTPAATATQASTIKAGDAVEISKENISRMKDLAGIQEAPQPAQATQPAIKVPPVPPVPQIPQGTVGEPKQDGSGTLYDLGGGSMLTVLKDGTKTFSSSIGTFTYDKTGKAIKYTAPGAGGMSGSVDLTSGTQTTNFSQGDVSATQTQTPAGKVTGTSATYAPGTQTQPITKTEDIEFRKYMSDIRRLAGQ